MKTAMPTEQANRPFSKMKWLIATAFAVVSPLATIPALATEQVPFVLSAECTTAGTRASGIRESCESEFSVYQAPAGYVIVKDQVQVADLSANGSHHDTDVLYDDWVEVIPGTKIYQPRVIKVRVRAMSEGGMFNVGVRGWKEAAIKGFISKLPAT